MPWAARRLEGFAGMGRIAVGETKDAVSSLRGLSAPYRTNFAKKFGRSDRFVIHTALEVVYGIAQAPTTASTTGLLGTTTVAPPFKDVHRPQLIFRQV